MFDIQNKLNKNHFHFIFLFILSLNYLVPYILFGKITLFYHDALDSEIVYNQIIGKYLSGDSTAINLFLNGEVQFDYLRRIYQPIIFLYAVFETEFAYWLTDIVVKLTSYISFFILLTSFGLGSFLFSTKKFFCSDMFSSFQTARLLATIVRLSGASARTLSTCTAS